MTKPIEFEKLINHLDEVISAAKAIRDSVDDPDSSPRKLILLLAMNQEHLAEALKQALADPLWQAAIKKEP